MFGFWILMMTRFRTTDPHAGLEKMIFVLFIFNVVIAKYITARAFYE